ncbi:MAG: hypothetical protein JWM11_6420 [Planctomycetaceae bacterium]|nr:hypothetical protein [Planctomycetaceae bacterium]
MRADQLINMFEYSEITIRYADFENISDGRGFTAERAGFTTSTGVDESVWLAQLSVGARFFDGPLVRAASK